MAVEAFLKPSDSKLTVEKEVKRKPSVEELTTVESPGRPSPANLLENNSAKKTKKRFPKKNYSDDIKISSVKKDSILIITEKPQAAMKIANAIGDARKLSEEGVNYYELEDKGNKIVVASAVGHLFGLTYKAGQKGWPIYELEWVPSFNRKESFFTKRYYSVLKKLSRRAKEIIIATDFDIEGEVIGWNVLRFICNEKNAKRMKFSTLTNDELRKSFDHPMKEMAWGNAYAGETRHILDWLYGINLSRALMSSLKNVGAFRLLSIGRVQGPALKIIVDREREIINFKPVPYWNVNALAEGVTFRHPKDIFDKKELEIFNGIKEAIANTVKTDENIEPGVPFDLTTLQREAYRVYKINPSEALKVAQQLYLDGLISYPRTSSQKIPKEIEPKKILKKLENNFAEAKNISRQIPIEGSKTDPAHPSIYPTGEYAGLSGNAEKLYNLIVKRFIACFYKDAIVARKKVTLDSKGIKFIANGLQIIDKGWTSFYPYKLEVVDLKDFNAKVIIDKIEFEDKQTQAPNRYTPTSLISILEKKNLGTKATRSMIVDTLFDRGYLDGKSIQATRLGMKLIESLEKHSPIIIDENLTRQLEEEMEKIQESSSGFEDQEKKVIEKAKRLINDISKEFKAKENEIGKDLLSGIEEIRKQQQENNTLMDCMTCKKGKLRILYSKKTRRYFVACSNYPECRQTFSLPPNALIKKAETHCEADKFPKLLAIRKGKRPWEFCFNPECPVEKAKREKWSKKSESESTSTG